MITLYNVVSADGYVAAEDGSEDFIPDELWVDFLDLCRQHEVLVMGRRTYEAIQEYQPELIKSLEDLEIRKVVVTRDREFVPKSGYVVAHSLQEACAGVQNILISSGPTINALALAAGLVEQVILNVLPQEIEKGLKVFNTEPNLELVSKEERGNGREWRVYRVGK